MKYLKHNIDVLTKTVAELKKSEQLLTDVIESAMIGLVTMTVDGKIKDVNNVFCQIMGYTKEELATFDINQITHPDDVHIENNIIDELLLSKAEKATFEKRFIHKKGNTIITHVKIVIIRDKLKIPQKIFAQIVDLTTQRKNEEKLIKSMQNYKALVDSAIDGIVVIQNDVIKFANQGTSELYGASLNNIIGQPFLQFVHADSKEMIKKRYADWRRGEKVPSYFEVDLINSKNEKKTCEIHSSTTTFEDQPAELALVHDITELKLVQKELMSSNKELIMFGKTLEEMNEMVSITDRDHKFIFINAAFEKTYGYCREEILGKTSKFLMAEEDSKLRNKIRKKTELGGWKGELINKRKDGTKFPIELSITPLRENGTIVAWIGISTNITERMNAEEVLRESEEKFKNAFQYSAIGMALVGTDGKWLSVNERVCDIVGYSKEELLKKTFQDITHPDDLDADLDYVSQMLAGEIKTYTMEKRYIHKNGNIVYVLLAVSLVKDDLGNPLYFISQINDITDRKHAEKLINESEEKFSSLVNCSPNIIMKVDSEGVINYINNEYSNQSPEDIIGQTIYRFIPPEYHEIARNTINKVFETGNSYSFENLGVGNSNNVIWFRNNIAPINNDGNIVAATILVIDISDEKQAKILQNEFVASISHELRTPLTVIRESLSLLNEGLFGKLNADQLDLVNPSIENIDKLSRILNNLLTISNLEGQKITLEREIVDIVELAKNTLSSFEIQAARKNIELVFSPSSNSINLYIDRERIIQVFMHLIGNAIKFTEIGTIEVIFTEKKDEIECCIVDTGKGIEQKDMGTLFDRFHQAGKIMKAGEKGASMGLSISKGIVKLHKGKIWVNSEIGKGSKFYFSLPKYGADEIIIDNIESEINKISGKYIKHTLLLVRLKNYHDIEFKFGINKTDKIIKLIHHIFLNELTPSEFSFIKEKNKVVVFSSIPEQNIDRTIALLKDMLARSVLKIDKDIMTNLSYGYSIYPDNGVSAKELIRNAEKKLLRKDKN